MAHVTKSISIWNLMSSADTVALSIVAILILLSIWTWSIIIDKYFRYRVLQKQFARFEDKFWSGKTIDKLYLDIQTASDNPLEIIFFNVAKELKKQRIQTIV